MAYRFNEIKLDKGMYSQPGKSFSQVLESLDPGENYKGTPLEGLDAFQRQLKRFDIKVRGAGSDTVEKFFSTSESSVLFPEYVSRSVKTGMEEGNILPSITASVTRFDGMDYRSIYSAASEDDKALRYVGEGAVIPQTEIRSADHLVKLRKRGRMLVASYEAIRFQRLDLFSVMLRQIGGQIMRMHLEDAIDVIRNGDGNGNAAETLAVGGPVLGGTAGTLSYSELLSFWNSFDPYTMNTLLAAPDVLVRILKCPEFQNPMTGLNFIGTGEAGNPLGAKLIRCSALPAGTAIGLDKGYALEMVTAGDVSVEYDRLIDRQLERAAITSISGFAKLYGDASRVLSV
ncbi:MAG: phage major capsid protein [Oscillospiraceae bacterium]|nr:phage major capsid protein [Oscillospiraceae bacterium]